MSNILFFFSALGAFNGLLMCIYLIFFNKDKGASKYLLAGLIISLSIRIGKSVFLHFHQGLPKIYLQVGLSACFLIGPFLFFYINSAVNRIVKIPTTWKATLLLFFIAVLSVGMVWPYEIYPDFWNQYVLYFIYWTWMAFIIGSSYIIRNLVLKVLQPDYSLNANERWILVIFIANLIIFICYFLVAYGLPSAYYLTGPLVFSFFLYLSIFGFFISDGTKFSAQKSLKKYASKSISDDEAERLQGRLSHLMKSEKLYLDPKLKLKGLADKMRVSSHLMSQFLNDNLNMSFASYVNEYRIEEACKLIHTADHLSLEGIGYEVGFNSKSTFFTTFKKTKGKTPAEYQKASQV